MKLIVAYLRPEILHTVKSALDEAGVHRISVTNALGCGAQKGYSKMYRGAEREINLLKKIRVEIAVNDSFEQLAIDTIVAAAKTGNIGDGKIFVLPLDRCIRIRTGEEGDDAIG